MTRFSITTLGCKVNQYDSCALATMLSRSGMLPAEAGQGPDLVVVNTCCVTVEAMRKSRQAIRRAVRDARPSAVLVVGCYSDYDGDRIRTLLGNLTLPPDRIFVAGHHSDLREQLTEVISALSAKGPSAQQAFWGEDDAQTGPQGREEGWMNSRVTGETDVLAHCHTFIIAKRNAAVHADAPGTRNFPPIERFFGHQRAFVKVQDGCDAFCTYCIVPYTRPRVWSRDVRDVLAECRQLVRAGHREIVLSGVFLGAFGRPTALRRRWKDTPSPLPRLLRAVARIDGLWRVRLSSLEPGDLTDELLAVFGECPTVAPHLHLPLQSGSPDILERMRRQYTADEYRRTIDRARSIMDHPAITTDIIVGFPGETDDDFEATLDLARHAGFAKIHAFGFSAIEGTVAWRRRREAPHPPVVKARMARLAEIERALAHAYRRPLVGQVMEALVESPRPTDAGDRQAMTDRYQTIYFRPPATAEPEQLTGQVVRLTVGEVLETGLRGEWLS